MDYETCALPTELTRLKRLTCLTQLMVSIHRPLGYGPSTLPLRHDAMSPRGISLAVHQPGIEPGANEWEPFILPLNHWCLSNLTM